MGDNVGTVQEPATFQPEPVGDTMKTEREGGIKQSELQIENNDKTQCEIDSQQSVSYDASKVLGTLTDQSEEITVTIKKLQQVESQSNNKDVNKTKGKKSERGYRVKHLNTQEPLRKSKSVSFVDTKALDKHHTITPIRLSHRQSKSFHGSQNVVSTNTTRLDLTSLTKKTSSRLDKREKQAVDSSGGKPATRTKVPQSATKPESRKRDESLSKRKIVRKTKSDEFEVKTRPSKNRLNAPSNKEKLSPQIGVRSEAWWC